jgi:hypothetical protein
MDSDALGKVEEFTVCSWTLDEYIDGDNFVVLGHTRMATH